MLIAKMRNGLATIADYQAKEYKDKGYEILNEDMNPLSDEEIAALPTNPEKHFAGI